MKRIFTIAVLMITLMSITVSANTFSATASGTKIMAQGTIDLPYTTEVSIYLLKPTYKLDDITATNFITVVQSLKQINVINGKFNAEFLMDDSAVKGEYTLYASAYGLTEALTSTVNYTGENRQSEYLETFNTGTYSQLEILFSINNKQDSLLLGLNIDEFLLKPEMAKTRIIKNIIDNRPYSNNDMAIKFNDFTKNWAKKEIDIVTQMPLGIIESYNGGILEPNGSVSVSDFAQMLICAINRPLAVNQTYIELAQAIGIIVNGEFTDYNRPITRYEAARMIVRSMREEFTDYIYDCIDDIKDYDNLPVEYKEYVLKAFAKGIMDGKDDGDFVGNDNVTREEAVVTMLRRIDQKSRVYRIPFYAYKNTRPYPEEVMAWTDAIKEQQKSAMVQLKSSLQAAINRGDAYFKIPAGDYRVGGSDAANIYINNAKNMIVDGTDATFWMMPSKGIQISGCENFTLKGLTIDNDPLPYTQGTIIDVDYTNFTVDIEYDIGFKEFEGDLTQKTGEKRVWVYDTDSILLKHQTVWDQINSVEKLPNGKYRVHFYRAGYFKYPWTDRTFIFSDFESQVVPGFKIVFGLGEASNPTISVKNSKNFTLDGVASYSSSGMNFVTGNVENMYVRNNKFKRRPGTGRLFSSLVDSMHVTESIGELVVENNEFSFAGDDCLAFVGRTFLVYKKLSDTEYLMWDRVATVLNPDNKFVAGSQYNIYDFEDMNLKGVVTVKSSEQVFDQTFLADAANMPNQIGADGYYFQEFGQCALWKVTFEDDAVGIPIEKRDFASNSENRGEGLGAVIRYNYFHDAIGRLLNPTGKTVEYNVFERSGVITQRFEHITCGYGMPKDTTIRHNIFVDTGEPGDPNRIPEATINSHLVTAKYFNTSAYDFVTIKNIRVMDNLFIRPADSAVAMSNVQDGVVTGNVVIQPTAKAPYGPYDFWHGANLTSAFTFNAIRNMTYGNNKIIEPTQYYTGELYLTPNVLPEYMNITNGITSLEYGVKQPCILLYAQYKGDQLVSISKAESTNGIGTLKAKLNEAVEYDRTKILLLEDLNTLKPISNP